MRTKEVKKKDTFLKELMEARTENAVDKYHFSKYWYFQKKVEKPEKDTKD